MTGLERLLGLLGGAAMVVLGSDRSHVAAGLESKGKRRHFACWRVFTVVLLLRAHYFCGLIDRNLGSGGTAKMARARL
jgi:hypothetical protein